MADNAAHAAEPGLAAPRSAPVVVKKYANRRLYNTETSSYVTLEDLAVMVRGEVALGGPVGELEDEAVRRLLTV